MPWKIMNAMNQKIQLIADWQSENFTITDLSKKYDVSRPIVYKWIYRFQNFGIDGLKDHIRAPKHHPNATPQHIVDLILNQKLENRKRGPKKVKNRLEKKYPDIAFPAISTIGNILKKNGLVKKRKKRIHVPPYTEPFVDCQSPNSVWSADYKGQFYTRNGKVCYPLTISDNYARYLLACKGLPGPRYIETREVFERTFRQYGLPDAIRTDNGQPFTGKCLGGLSRLSIWWIQLGIIPERIDKGCPQQNGRHERMHRTLKYEALDSVANNIKEQQYRFDIFREDYNNDRPHESLNNKTPNEYYKNSTRPYIENPPLPEYDLDYTVRRVRHNGEIKFKGNTYFLTELLPGHPVGLKQIDNDQWRIFYSFLAIGTLDLRKNKIIKEQ